VFRVAGAIRTVEHWTTGWRPTGGLLWGGV
jgi:hypothetical protein